MRTARFTLAPPSAAVPGKASTTRRAETTDPLQALSTPPVLGSGRPPSRNTVTQMISRHELQTCVDEFNATTSTAVQARVVLTRPAGQDVVVVATLPSLAATAHLHPPREREGEFAVNIASDGRGGVPAKFVFRAVDELHEVANLALFLSSRVAGRRS